MIRRKIAIIGSTGQLGSELVGILKQDESFEVLPLSHSDCDCTRLDQTRAVLSQLRPHTVINCAAYVRVDDCEDHGDEAFRVNAVGALNVAKVCAEIDALCLYVSTDYVFDGRQENPYVESASPCPINVYGASKLAGEFLVRQAAPRSLIVRSASLFGKTGARGKGGNFVETILSRAKIGQTLTIVNDVRMSPTYARDAAVGLGSLVKTATEGIVHLANEGACSWYEFAALALELTGLQTTVIPVSSQDYPARARRPKNSALRSERSLVKLRGWEEALKAYLIEKGHLGTAGSKGQSNCLKSQVVLKKFSDQ